MVDAAEILYNQKPKFKGLVEEGNIDLNNRPIVKNNDGSISTVRSMSVEMDGQHILIPTVVGNKVVSDKEAFKHFQETGEHLGIFDNQKDADKYAQKLHKDQEKLYVKPRGLKDKGETSNEN